MGIGENLSLVTKQSWHLTNKLSSIIDNLIQARFWNQGPEMLRLPRCR
jgi:hypothetical protein